MLWAMLCLNVSAGLGLISQHSPLAQDIYKKTYGLTGDLTPEQVAIVAPPGGAVVAYAAIFNGLGACSGQKFPIISAAKWYFLLCLPPRPFVCARCQRFCCNILAFCHRFLLSFGLLRRRIRHHAAFAADAFGPAYIGKVYGFMLTAWSTAYHRPLCF
jgi:OFA family oxalate/formate antiporter-like MFS transporter